MASSLMSLWAVCICVVLVALSGRPTAAFIPPSPFDLTELTPFESFEWLTLPSPRGIPRGQANAAAPTIADAFTSPTRFVQTFSMTGKGNSSFVQEGPFEYSVPQSGLSFFTEYPVPEGPPGIQSLSTLYLNNAKGNYYILQGVCRQISANPFAPWFDWLDDGTLIGTAPCLTSGTSPICQIWFLDVPAKSITLKLYVNDSLPYRYQIDQNFSWGEIVSTYFYEDPVVVSSLPASDFESPATCTESYAPPCPYSPLRPVLDMVRFHEVNQSSLVNQNTGDLIGDVLFLCSTIVSGTSFKLQQVSWYEVQVNFTFGGYAYCNLGNCWGGDPYLVGREAAMGLGLPAAGMCAPNPYGVWFSLPEKGECRQGQTIEAGQCTWKTLNIKKTLSLECLMDRGFAQACLKDPVAPYQLAVETLLKAFASTDPSQGGCPDV